MFYDLNVKKSDSPNWESLLQGVVERLHKYGYRRLAIATEAKEDVFEKQKKEKESKKKGEKSGSSENKEKQTEKDSNEIIPLPPDLKDLKSKYPDLVFFNRINIVVSDSNNLRKFLQCKNMKKYDLVSFQPENQTVLKALSSTPEMDIISFSPECKSDLTFNRKFYNQLVNQNVYFEITYGPAIADSTARRNLLSLSHTYKAIGKSRNIIVTSGAHRASYIRGPYDVINFNQLFGLSEEQSKSSITRTCEKLILRARRQRRNKSVMEIVRTTTQPAKMEICEEENK